MWCRNNLYRDIRSQIFSNFFIPQDHLIKLSLKIVVSLYLIKHNAMATYEGMEVVLPAFLTLALRLNCFAPTERAPGTVRLGECEGHKVCLDVARNREIFCSCLELNPDSSVVQPTAYYEGWAGSRNEFS